MDEQEDDYDYYRRRAGEELAKAQRTSDPGLAAKHRQLSSIYASRALHAERRRELDSSDDEPGDPQSP